MNSLGNDFNGFFADNIPSLVAQGGLGGLEGNIFKTSPVDPSTLLWVLGTLSAIIIGLVYGTHKYKQWKKFKEFEEEMASLDLKAEDEGTLSHMVRRYKMAEPVNVLISERLFDEMATKEIMRVLASSGSKESKEEFIDVVYRIRMKTYHRDWLREPQEEEEEEESQEMTAGVHAG